MHCPNRPRLACMNGVKKVKVMARLIWSMTLLAILSVVSPIAASNLLPLPYIHCGQTQPSNAYDGTSALFYDYDSANTHCKRRRERIRRNGRCLCEIRRISCRRDSTDASTTRPHYRPRDRSTGLNLPRQPIHELYQ